VITLYHDRGAVCGDAGRLRDSVGDAGEGVQDVLAYLRLEGANRELQVDFVRNDVVFRAAVDRANGEPGIGKSTALEQEVARLALNDAHAVDAIRVDLGAFSSEEMLHRRVFESRQFQDRAAGTSHLSLHLDSLDEALLRIDSIAKLLAGELPRHPTERLSIRIACRTAVWPAQTLEPALSQIWGEAAVGAFELAPLRRSDVILAASLHGIDGAAFVQAAIESGVVPLAIKPLTLNMLLGIYSRPLK
jgi:hypothetical protein